MSVGAVLLAAGESSRMGQPKAELEWCGKTLLAYQLDQLRASRCERVAVVLGHAADRLRTLVRESSGRGSDGLTVSVVVNPDYRAGKATSIRVGARALPADLSAIVVLAVDQPRPSRILDRLVAARELAGAPVAVPVRDGRRGHPPVFGAALRAELESVDESDEGLRAVLRRHAADALAVEMDDEIIHLNLNTPAEYAVARERFGM